MGGQWPVLLLGLAAALAYGASTSLKHVSAGHVPDAQDFAVRKLTRLLRATLSHPLWLAGIGCDVVGLLLHILALHLGTLTVVQPLLVTGLLFTLVIRQRFEHYRVSRRQGAWAIALTAALAGFLFLTGGSGTRPAAADPLPAAVAAGLAAVAVGVLVALGRRHRGSARSATLLGVALGVIYASTAALLKVVSGLATGGPVALLASWQLYAVLAVGASGILLEQVAYQAGPITASVPAAVTVDPLASVVLGVVVFDEPLRSGLLAGGAAVALLIVLAVSTIQIARARVGDEVRGAAAAPGPGADAIAGSAPRPEARAARRDGSR